MIGFAVIVGYFVSKPASVDASRRSPLGFVTGFAICAFSMVINDYYDIEVDRVNQPDRPLPSGAVSKGGAVALAVRDAGGGAGGRRASLLNWAAVVIARLYALLAWLYDYRAKKYGLAGNLIVASSLAIPFIYGGVVSGGERHELAPPLHGRPPRSSRASGGRSSRPWRTCLGTRRGA